MSGYSFTLAQTLDGNIQAKTVTLNMVSSSAEQMFVIYLFEFSFIYFLVY